MPTTRRRTTRATTAVDADVAEGRKRLAVFCDGTWNDLRMKELTNVARLAKCVEPRGWDGRRQVVFYDSGVGVATGVSHVADRLVTVLGGAIGAGLDDKIENAYRFLVLNYEPGDEIFVFGFSRGAYTARSLCGLIRKCGIVRRDCFDKIVDAMTLYRDTRLKPDSDELRAFREAHTCRDPRTGAPLATSAKDLGDDDAWKSRSLSIRPSAGERRPPDEGEPNWNWLPPEPPPLSIYRLMYLGVWDTVGSMGIPPTIPFLSRLINKRFEFYDTDASSLLFSIRHACALDEDRKSFDITPVRNIHDLNMAWAKVHGRQVDDAAKPGYVAFTDRPFQQRWFPGAHGSIGGGNRVKGISSGTLVWIAVGAMRAGLKFDWKDSELSRAKDPAHPDCRNPMAPYRIGKKGEVLQPWQFSFIGFLTGYADRMGVIPKSKPPTLKQPTTPDELHGMAKTRYGRDPTYRPATMGFFGERKVGPTPLHRIVARIAGILTLAALAVLLWWLVTRWGVIWSCVSGVICRA